VSRVSMGSLSGSLVPSLRVVVSPSTASPKNYLRLLGIVPPVTSHAGPSPPYAESPRSTTSPGSLAQSGCQVASSSSVSSCPSDSANPHLNLSVALWTTVRAGTRNRLLVTGTCALGVS
jgi:hypothetical protein